MTGETPRDAARPDAHVPRASTPRTSDWEDAARRAFHRDAGELDAEAREVLACTIDATPYAIPIERVREIVRPRRLTPVPRTPAYLLGVLSLRGDIVQVIDLRRRLGLAPAEAAPSSRIVVLTAGDDGVAGLWVDAVREVLRIDESTIRPASAAETRVVAEIGSHGGDFVSILDLDRVLDHAD